MEAGYNSVYLWAAAVEAAGTTVEAVKAAAGNASASTPERTVTIDDNQHV